MMNKDVLNGFLHEFVEVDDVKYGKLEWYLRELLKWNKKINLTSITNIDECWEKHIVDSLQMACFIDATDTVLDIGSGAGFPSLPLKIINDTLRIESVDSVTKKIRFQRHCARHLGMEDFIAHASRIEHLQQNRAAEFDVVISRAFTSLDRFIEIAFPFMKPDGRILAMKGAAAEKEIASSQPVLNKYGLFVTRKEEVLLPFSKSERVMIEIKKQD